MEQEIYVPKIKEMIVEEVPSLGVELPGGSRKLLQNAGILFFLAASLILMGIITGEIFYPADFNYNTGRNDISDLGGTMPPEGLVTQPSAAIFDSAMILGGVLLLLGAYFFYRGSEKRSFGSLLFLFGFGALGVGVFPGNIALWHPLFAMLTFFSGAIAAIVSYKEVKTPIRYVFVVLGIIALFFLIFNQSFIYILGSGGTERWVAYPIILWTLGFGGYLAGKNARVQD